MDPSHILAVLTAPSPLPMSGRRLSHPLGTVVSVMEGDAATVHCVERSEDRVVWSVRSYDSDPATYAKRYAQIDVARYRQWVLQELSDVKRVRILDVGCGGGRDAAAFSAAGNNVIGVDLSFGMLRESRRAFPLLDLARADTRAIPVRTSSVAAVWSMASLVHLDQVAMTSALLEFSRVLVAGGLLFVSLPSGLRAGWRYNAIGGPRWFECHKSDVVSSAVMSAGFEVVRIEDAPGISRGTWISLLARKRA